MFKFIYNLKENKQQDNINIAHFIPHAGEREAEFIQIYFTLIDNLINF